MISSKIKALANCRNVAGYGADFRSKKILFTMNLLNGIGYHKMALREKINKRLQAYAKDGLLHINVKIAGKAVPLIFRFNDFSDYQSVGECLGDMYPIADVGYEYLLDCGANIGFFSVMALHNLKLKEVILVEPSPKNLEILDYNFKNLKQCKVYPYAVSDKEGSVTFELSTSNTGHISGSAGFDGVATNTITVQTKRLRDILPKNWDLKKTILKVDIEGAEYDVFDDMIADKIFPKIIMSEIHDYLNNDGIGLVKKLEACGYHVTVDGVGDSGNVCRQIIALQE